MSLNLITYQNLKNNSNFFDFKSTVSNRGTSKDNSDRIGVILIKRMTRQMLSESELEELREISPELYDEVKRSIDEIENEKKKKAEEKIRLAEIREKARVEEKRRIENRREIRRIEKNWETRINNRKRDRYEYV